MNHAIRLVWSQLFKQRLILSLYEDDSVVSPSLFLLILREAEERVSDLTLPIETRARAALVVDLCLAELAEKRLTREEMGDLDRAAPLGIDPLLFSNFLGRRKEPGSSEFLIQSE